MIFISETRLSRYTVLKDVPVRILISSKEFTVVSRRNNLLKRKLKLCL